MLGLFVKLHLHQLLRALKEIGLGRLILLGPMGLYLLLRMVFLPMEMPSFGWLPPVLLILTIQVSRKDFGFLRLLYFSTYRLLASEYLLLALPWSIVYLIDGNGLFSLIGPACAVVAPLIKVNLDRLKGGFDWAGNIFPVEAFEWKSGVRKHFLSLAIVYILCLVFCQFVASGLAYIALMTGFIIEFFTQAESRPMIQAISASPNRFLWQRIRLQLAIFWLLALPHVGLFLIFHHTYWYILLYFVVMFSIVQAFYVAFKYAAYRPDASLKGNTLMMAFVWGSCFIPFFTPIPILMLIWNLMRAGTNLRFYMARELSVR